MTVAVDVRMDRNVLADKHDLYDRGNRSGDKCHWRMWWENPVHSVAPEVHLRRVEGVSAAELKEKLELLALIQGSRSTLHIDKPPGHKTPVRRLNTLIPSLRLCVCVRELSNSVIK